MTQQEIIDRVNKDALDAGAEIQKKVNAMLTGFTVTKYYVYDNAEHDTRIGEKVFIIQEHTLDWKSMKVYTLQVRKSIQEPLNKIMKGYNIHDAKVDISNKGKTARMIFGYDKMYEVDE